MTKVIPAQKVSTGAFKALEGVAPVPNVVNKKSPSEAQLRARKANLDARARAARDERERRKSDPGKKMRLGVPVKRALGRPREYDRAAVVEHVCTELRKGRSLTAICTKDPGMPDEFHFRTWVEHDSPPGTAKEYALAREIGYSLLADEIIALSDATHAWVMIHAVDEEGKPRMDAEGKPVLIEQLMPLNSDIVAHKRVQIETRKWMLSKMLPKVYGDKIVQEHTGADGGPIAIAAVDLKQLTDVELVDMQRLLTKADGGVV